MTARKRLPTPRRAAGGVGHRAWGDCRRRQARRQAESAPACEALALGGGPGRINTHLPHRPGGLAMPRRLLLPGPALLLAALPLFAADAPADTAHGDRLRDAHFRRAVRRIADASLADVKTR